MRTAVRGDEEEVSNLRFRIPAARTSPLVIERSYGISRVATPQQPAGALRSRRCSVRNRCSSPITALMVLAPVLALTLLVLALTLLVLALTLLVLALTLLVLALTLLVFALTLLVFALTLLVFALGG
jgi:hypothetical protein